MNGVMLIFPLINGNQRSNSFAFFGQQDVERSACSARIHPFQTDVPSLEFSAEIGRRGLAPRAAANNQYSRFTENRLKPIQGNHLGINNWPQMSFPTCDQNGSLIGISANAEASASIALD